MAYFFENTTKKFQNNPRVGALKVSRFNPTNGKTNIVDSRIESVCNTGGKYKERKI